MSHGVIFGGAEIYIHGAMIYTHGVMICTHGVMMVANCENWDDDACCITMVVMIIMWRGPAVLLPSVLVRAVRGGGCDAVICVRAICVRDMRAICVRYACVRWVVNRPSMALSGCNAMLFISSHLSPTPTSTRTHHTPTPHTPHTPGCQNGNNKWKLEPDWPAFLSAELFRPAFLAVKPSWLSLSGYQAFILYF